MIETYKILWEPNVMTDGSNKILMEKTWNDMFICELISASVILSI